MIEIVKMLCVLSLVMVAGVWLMIGVLRWFESPRDRAFREGVAREKARREAAARARREQS